MYILAKLVYTLGVKTQYLSFFYQKVPNIDREFEKKISSLDIDDELKKEMIRQAQERSQSLQEQIEKMKESLRQRKDRKKPAKLSDEERNGMSAEEQQGLLEAREIQSEADREREDKALLEARKLLEKVLIHYKLQICLYTVFVTMFKLIHNILTLTGLEMIHFPKAC